jgi:hypothetical protein
MCAHNKGYGRDYKLCSEGGCQCHPSDDSWDRFGWSTPLPELTRQLAVDVLRSLDAENIESLQRVMDTSIHMALVMLNVTKQVILLLLQSSSVRLTAIGCQDGTTRDADAVLDMEADLVATIIALYDGCRADTDDGDVFVVTPHHSQRRAVLTALAARNVPTSLAVVDTVERMQGQERDMIIVCYGFADR